MLNSLDLYRETGRKAGRAMRNHDAGLFRHLTDWKTRAIRYESPENQQAARDAFDAGYAEYRRDL